jgi:hypothetical protein
MMRDITRRPGCFYSALLGVAAALCVACGFPGVSVCHAEKPGSEPALPSLAAVMNGAIGPFDKYCDGYGNTGASGLGYICAMTLDIGMVEQDMDTVLDGIVSYDRAEAQGVYIGQINMLVASSFCGLNGALWGYDLARADEIASGKVQALFEVLRHDRKKIPIYSADPLLDAAAMRECGVNKNDQRTRRWTCPPFPTIHQEQRV